MVTENEIKVMESKNAQQICRDDFSLSKGIVLPDGQCDKKKVVSVNRQTKIRLENGTILLLGAAAFVLPP